MLFSFSLSFFDFDQFLNNTSSEDLIIRRQSTQDAGNADLSEIPPNPHQIFPELSEEELRYVDQFLNSVSPEDLANTLSLEPTSS